MISVFVALPFYLSNYQVTFLNSLFESISGITGTGFSIFKNIKYLDPTNIMEIFLTMDGWAIFFIFLVLIFSNKQFNYKMSELTYSENGNINSESNIKDILIKIFICYSALSFIIFTIKHFRSKNV